MNVNDDSLKAPKAVDFMGVHGRTPFIAKIWICNSLDSEAIPAAGVFKPDIVKLNSTPGGISDIVYIFKDPSSNVRDAKPGLARFPCPRVKEGSLIRLSWWCVI